MEWGHIFLLYILADLLILSMGQVSTNQPPVWDVSSFSSLTQGVDESTPVTTKLVQLRCIDPEDDPIIYVLETGNTVRVDSNGAVYLALQLDREQTNPLGYNLAFSCVDSNRTTGFPLHKPVRTNTQISVNDANDNPPVFQVANTKGYSFSIREDAPNGTQVEASIQTIDRDITVNAVLKTMYLICNSPNATERDSVPATSKAFCEKFVLTYRQVSEGVYNATVNLNGKLDYEERPVYTSKIVAIDGPGLAVSFTSTVNIQINIIDSQDQPPAFTNPGDTTTISEGAPIGSTIVNFGISARDGDTGDKRAINISIIDDPKNAFTLTYTAEVKPDNGIYSSQLIIKNQLDRETNVGAYYFVVKATEIDKNTSQLTTATATATYSVYVSDINDNKPTFLLDVYNITVTEVDFNVMGNYTMQVTGLQVLCYDLDEGSNAMYSVSIVRQTIGQGANVIDVNDAYSISPDLAVFIGNASLYLKVNNSTYLDYDNPLYRFQTVVLVARETDTKEKLSSSTTINIYVQDINDNAPVFDQLFYQTNVSEDSTFPTVLLTIKAVDADEGINGQVRYQLEGGFSGKFSIDSVTGVLSMIGPLDYETVSQYVFLVVASDQGPEPKSNQIQVIVNVLNANDVPPRFQQAQYQTSASESTLSFLNPLTIVAVDDEADTQQITYRIVGGQSTNESFAINLTTGELTLRAFLDYTDTPSNGKGGNTGVYVLDVEASDNGKPTPLTATVKIYVSVIDENNHFPVLSPTLYYAVLNETVKQGTLVAVINGTDADSGDNGKLSYRLGEGSTDNFAVDESTGEVTVGPASFDYDVQNRYTLTIIATDGGAPQKSAVATVYVNITDSNNKDPFFDKPLYLINTDDRLPVGTGIFAVQAFDYDSTASLQYSISTDSVSATGPDGTTLRDDNLYPFKTAFGVNETGGIYIAHTLNHNVMTETSFKVVAKDINTQADIGTGTGTTQIIIIIKGAVDTAITFDGATRAIMNENAPLGTTPITVIAKDAKKQPIRDFVKVNGSDYFDVNGTTGGVSLVKDMDYETDTTPYHLHTVVICAYSENREQSATTTVSIEIIDVNDNAPQFSQQSYTANISENTRFPTTILTMSATDADSISYGPLDFALVGLDSDDFQISLNAVPGGSRVSRVGNVYVGAGKILDYNRRTQYDLTIIVADNQRTNQSSIRRSSSAALTVYIIDENNNSPVFSAQSQTSQIGDNALAGRIVTTVLATDQDRGVNGLVTYTLETTEFPDSALGVYLFSMDPTSGVISVAKTLAPYSNQIFHMRVRATDGGTIPNYAILDLDIFVFSTEVSDGNPKWLLPPSGYIFYAPEETSNYTIKDMYNNSRVFNVTARIGTGIVFALSPSQGYANKFSINPTTGEITIIDKLDRDEQETYELRVIAEDTNNTARYQSVRSFTLKLWDINDNVPLFTNFSKNYKSCQPIDRPVEVSVKENIRSNITVFTLRACDPDSAANALINYTMYNDDPACAKYNNISAVTVASDGELVTRRVIDYEQDKEFILCVKASPMNPSSRRKKRAFNPSEFQTFPNDVAYIHITVLDENDNGPKFANSTASGIVQTDPGSSPVVVMNAVDLDGRDNNNILYHIENSIFYPQGNAPSGPFDGAFALRGAKAALYPAQASYEAYSGGRFVLTVVATDSANNSLADSQEVTIYVYEKRHPVKAIVNLRPEVASQFAQELVTELNGVSNNYNFNFLRVSQHVTQDSLDPSRTDICFLTVDSQTNDILNIRQVIQLLAESRYQTVLKQDQYKITDEGQCFPAQSSESSIKWRDLWWVLVAVAIFIFVCCVILVILISILYDRYKRYMDSKPMLETQ